MRKKITGIAASDGYAHAKVYRLIEPDLTVEKIEIEDPAIEIERLNEAIEKSNAEIGRIREIAAQSLGEEEAQVFDAHSMILSDPEMTGKVDEAITTIKINAEAADEEVTEIYITLFVAQ